MSLKLLYTGVTEFLTPQSDPSKSIGYYVSSTEVPNGQINALFPSIPQQLNNTSSLRTVRAICIHNPTSSAINNIQLHYEQNSQQPVSRYLMGLIAPAKDDCNDFYFEKLVSESALPNNISLINNRGSGNAIAIPTIAPGAYLGLWLVREVSASRVNGPLGECSNLFDRFKAEESSSIVEIETVADVNDSLDGQSFMIYSPDGKRYNCWIDITGNFSLDVNSIENIRFSDIATNDTANDVASKIQSKLQDVLGFDDVAQVIVDNNLVTLTFTNSGSIVVPDTSNTSFTFNITQGSSSSLEQQEDITLHLFW